MADREMKVLVCGGLDFDDMHRVFDLLTFVEPTAVIDGGAKGADAGAANYASVCGVPEFVYEPEWDRYATSFEAVWVANEKMLEEQEPDLVLAFPGGKGTADMVNRAKNHGVEVVLVGYVERDLDGMNYDRANLELAIRRIEEAT